MSAAKLHATGREPHPVWVRALFVLIVLAAGVGAMGLVASFRKEPAAAEHTEPVFRARGMVVNREDYSTVLRGYGTARAPRTTALAPQVSGRIVEVREGLEAGVLVDENELLFRIDPTDYRLAVSRAEAEVARTKAEIERLRRENENDQRRVEIARRQLEIARREYERIRQLVDQGGVESPARLDQAEEQLVQREDVLATVEQRIELFPANLQVAEANLESAQASLKMAELDLDRTEIRSPFAGRIVSEDVEVGEYATTTGDLIRLADSTFLEVPVSLDGGEVSRWLTVRLSPDGGNWLLPDGDIPVELAWHTEPGQVGTVGKVSRISRFDPDTRTFELIVEVPAQAGSRSGFPLLEGMFLDVAVSGRTAEDVFVLPREALDSQGNVLISREGRLGVVPVEIVRYEEDVALVSEGLDQGSVVLTTRPARVLEGLKLDVELLRGDEPESI